MPRLISWNIRHGGGRRVPQIIAALRRHAPDIVVLPEFRNNENGRVTGWHEIPGGGTALGG